MPAKGNRGARPFTRAQAMENGAFLKELRRTGNVREAARALGVHRATFLKRRAGHPAFATAWDAALAVAHARLAAAAAGRPEASVGRGGERMIRTASGRVQLRRLAPGRLTREGEQAFLAALSATANVRLSAAAAGFAHSTFYWRARRHEGFRREMRLALEIGYRRLEAALLESTTIESHADDAWRHNEPLPIPPMTANQALQLMYLHQKEATFGVPDQLRLRPGETSELRSLRLQLLHEFRLEREREKFRLAEASRRGDGPIPGETPPWLPALDQVTGWSKASGRPAHDATRALFGGWRLKDWEGE